MSGHICIKEKAFLFKSKSAGSCENSGLSCRYCRKKFLLISELQRHSSKHCIQRIRCHKKNNSKSSAQYQNQNDGSVLKVHQVSELLAMNSPSQKDSGIDDSSPLSYDDPVEQAQIKVFSPIAKEKSLMTDKVSLVDSSTNEKTPSDIEVENHNSVSPFDCETCVDKSIVVESVQLVHKDLHQTKVKLLGGQVDESIIVIHGDEDDEVEVVDSCQPFVGTGSVDVNEVSQSKQSFVRLSSDSTRLSVTSQEEVVISSTTSPERDGLLKDAGLLTDSVVSSYSVNKKGASLKTGGIFDIFNIGTVDSTDDLIQVKRDPFSASKSFDKNQREQVTEVDPCDSTQNVCVTDRPALFSIFDLGTSSVGDIRRRIIPTKECLENKSNPDGLRRNIFEVLAQQTTLHTPEKMETFNDGAQDEEEKEKESVGSSLNEKGATKTKACITSSRNKGTDFESATGESQFNFYNSNETAAIKESCMDSSGIMYNDCYMADEGDIQSLQNTCSSLQSDENDCSSQGGQTPSKYAFLSQDSTRVLSLTEMSVGEEEPPKREAVLDYQCEYARFLQGNNTPRKASALLVQESDELSPSKESVGCRSGLHQDTTSGWTMSSRQIKCFQTSHQRLVLLRRKVCKFLRLVFPFLQYPTYFKTHAVCVENLLDQLTCIIDGSKSKCHTQHAIPTEQSCCDVRVVVCKSPRQCLNYLRRKIVRFLQTVLPELKMNPSFDTSSEMVESLLQQIIICNQNLEKSS